MTHAATPALAAAFHALHAQDAGLLLLANAWDGGSARLAQGAGARAIATTSAGMAWAQGWPDGNALPTELLVQAVATIAAAVALPLTVDIEAGYSDDPERVADLVEALMAAGAVGINIEDGSGDPELLCRKIAAARRVARQRAVDLFINARTDVYLADLAAPGRRVDEVIARARRYSAAGASGLFVPGVVLAADITAIVADVRLPVNVLARPGLPERDALQALGVRRYSVGSSIAAAAYGLAAAMMREVHASGRLDAQGLEVPSYAQLNTAMARQG